MIKKYTYDWDEFWSYDTGNDESKDFFSKDSPYSAVNAPETSFFSDAITWDVFVYAMAIGKFQDGLLPQGETCRKPLKKSSRSFPLKWAKEHHLNAILGLVFSLKEVDMSIIKRPRDIKKICEEYANAGAIKLVEFEKTRDPGNPIEDYEKELLKFLDKSKTIEE